MNTQRGHHRLRQLHRGRSLLLRLKQSHANLRHLVARHRRQLHARTRSSASAFNPASSSRHEGRFQNEACYFDSCFLPDGCIVQPDFHRRFVRPNEGPTPPVCKRAPSRTKRCAAAWSSTSTTYRLLVVRAQPGRRQKQRMATLPKVRESGIAPPKSPPANVNGRRRRARCLAARNPFPTIPRDASERSTVFCGKHLTRAKLVRRHKKRQPQAWQGETSARSEVGA